MKHSREISSFLLIAMLLPLNACGSNDDAAESVVETTAATAAVVETEPSRTPHSLPDTLDFGGDSFHVLHSADFKRYYFAEEEIGEIMNDAVYDRRIFVEETLNVKMTDYLLDGGQIHAEMQKSVMSGDDVYDYTMMHCIAGVADLVTNGYLYDYADLPHIDLNAEWWDLDLMEQLSLGEKLTYGVSDIIIPNPYVIIFNKEMIQNNNLVNPYQMVYDGTWTLDNFIALCTAAVADLDGDGAMTLNDRVGVMGIDGSLFSSFMTGADQYLTRKGADGKIEMIVNNEKMHTIAEKMLRLAETPGAAWCTPDENHPKMDSGRVLFYLGGASYAESMREVDVEIGILPYPKFDEAQDEYLMLDWGGLTCVPNTITNPEMVGAVLELMSWDSANGVLPAYYDTILAGKLARDDDCRNMLELIFDSITYDIGLNYFGFDAAFNEFLYFIGNKVIGQKNADFASIYAKREKSLIRSIEKFYERLEETENANN